MVLILLAAGQSRRFGENKLFHKIGSCPIYRHVLEIYDHVAGIEKKIIVSAYDQILEEAKEFGYICIKNQRSELGISHSIRLGMREACRHSCKDLLFAVCDQPFLKPESVNALIAGYYASGKSLAGIGCGEDIGNPCIFNIQWANSLLRLRKDRGGKEILLANPNLLYRLEGVDPCQLRDIDRPEDLIAPKQKQEDEKREAWREMEAEHERTDRDLEERA
ncbi:MAG: nucleotidyltransferase family protein [Johnsonella sp.]|nr:nucleotidyltransferase family protein [Johnsonella sp.]